MRIFVLGGWLSTLRSGWLVTYPTLWVAGYLPSALSSVAIMMLYNTQLQVPGCTTVGVFCSCVWGQLGLPGRLCWCWLAVL